MEHYLNVIECEKLTQNEEIELGKRIKDGSKTARDILIKHNLRFVVSVARNYLNQGLMLDDLIAQGNLGLIRAAIRYDYTKNFKFISYAVWWVRQAILQGLADNSRIVKIPINKATDIHNVENKYIELIQKLQRIPTYEEVAAELDMSIEKVENIKKFNSSHVSMNVPVGDENEKHVIDIFTYDVDDDVIPNSDEQGNNYLLKKKIRELMSALNEREVDVIKYYFGLNESNFQYSLDDIGKIYDVSRERIRQIKECAIGKLKRAVKVVK